MLNVKEVVKPAAILFVICVIVACTLAGTNALTKDRIEAQQAAKAEQSRRIVLPAADSFEAAESYYIGLAGGEVAGYVFETQSKGYGGTVKIMTGIDTDGSITGVVILEHEETPGLGANAEKEAFRDQFKQTAPSQGIAVVRYQTPGSGEIEAMTGASITSRAVTDAVNQAIRQYWEVTA